MKPNETLAMLYGELMDLISCKQIAEGKATQKRVMTIDEILALR